jgi:anti-sigma B factor antagonist
VPWRHAAIGLRSIQEWTISDELLQLGDGRNKLMSDLFILTPQGRIDVSSGSDLLAQVTASLADSRADLLIDFQDVSFMDSSGFGALVMALKRVRQSDRQLYLCNLNGQLKLVLELTSMDRVFTVFESRTDCQDFLAAR